MGNNSFPPKPEPPHEGAVVMHCGHLGGEFHWWQQPETTIGWLYHDDVGRLRKAFWCACCQECFDAAGGEPRLRMVRLAGYGEWADVRPTRTVGFGEYPKHGD